MTNINIPRIFHQIWIGPSPLSREIINYRKSWIYHHPEWELKLWTGKKLPELLNQKLYDKADILAEKVDIARYDLIYQYGGVFLDIEFECFKNIEPLLTNVKAFASANWNNRYISNGILGAVPEHPAYKKLVFQLKKWIPKHQNAATNIKTGPIYVTRMLRNREDIHILKSHYFFPYSPEDTHLKNEIFPEAYAAHHWKTHKGERWTEKE